MLRTHTVHPYIMDTTLDEKGRFFESPFAVHGTMHTEKQDNEYYERYIEGKEEYHFSHDSTPQVDITFERKESKGSTGDVLKKKLLLLGSAE